MPVRIMQLAREASALFSIGRLFDEFSSMQHREQLLELRFRPPYILSMATAGSGLTADTAFQLDGIFRRHGSSPAYCCGGGRGGAAAAAGRLPRPAELPRQRRRRRHRVAQTIGARAAGA